MRSIQARFSWKMSFCLHCARNCHRVKPNPASNRLMQYRGIKHWRLKMARTLIQMSIGTAAGAVMITMMVTVMAFTGAFA